ncbi:MAG TPA: hypothetical protein VKR58_11990, partial [Aquella sp.]|nr:hypothetical protein [Aquella sp.]
MNKIKKIIFSTLFVISSIVWGDEIEPMYTGPDGPNGLAWFITIVNNTGNLISVGKTVPGGNNNWNLSIIGGNSLLDSG